MFALGSPEGIARLRAAIDRPAALDFDAAWNSAPSSRDHALGEPAHGGDPGKPILTIRNLSKRFGSLVTAQDMDLDVHPFRLHSFIGPNGAGKTTFFNMLTGFCAPIPVRCGLKGRTLRACR